MIGQQRERNVVRSLAAVGGEEFCVTTLKSHNQKVNTRDIFNSLVKKRTLCMKSIVISCTNSSDR